MKRRFVLVLLLLWPFAALANDSIAGLAAGGIYLTNSEDISIESEDLYINTRTAEVRVTYLFKNHADHDIATLVAFPMPEMYPHGGEASFSVPSGFQLQIDGEPMACRKEVKAMQGERDVTGELAQAGISPFEPFWMYDHTIRQIPPELKRQLLKENIIGQYDEDDYYANWTIKETYYWEQVFPAYDTVRVSHHYYAGVGGSLGGLPFGEITEACCADGFSKPGFNCRRRIYTIDGFNQTIHYILKTATHWKGPIARFQLTIEHPKDDQEEYPADMICIGASFCGNAFHIEQPSPTMFTFTAHNFVPTEDLTIFMTSASVIADPNEQLLIGAGSGDIHLVQDALALGADLEARDEERELLTFLEWEGGEDKALYPKTALMLAAGAGYTHIVELLLKHGADVHASDGNGQTALQIAEKRGHADIVRILKAAGVR